MFFRRFGSCWRSQSAHCVGFNVMAFTALMMAVTAMTRANWRYICPVMPGMNAGGRKTDMSTRVMPMIGTEQFAHGINARLLGGLPAFDMLGGAFHHDDGVIHDNANGQHDGKESEQIDAEPEQRPCRRRRR